MGQGRVTAERRLSTTSVPTGRLWTTGAEVQRVVIDQASGQTFLETDATNIAHGLSPSRWIDVRGWAYNGTTILPLPHIEAHTGAVETDPIVAVSTFTVDGTNITSVVINAATLSFTGYGVQFLLEYV